MDGRSPAVILTASASAIVIVIALATVSFAPSPCLHHPHHPPPPQPSASARASEESRCYRHSESLVSCGRCSAPILCGSVRPSVKATRGADRRAGNRAVSHEATASRESSHEVTLLLASNRGAVSTQAILNCDAGAGWFCRSPRRQRESFSDEGSHVHFRVYLRAVRVLLSYQ
jgi:hypothetical protein